MLTVTDGTATKVAVQLMLQCDYYKSLHIECQENTAIKN